jgi:hypothetical protein
VRGAGGTEGQRAEGGGRKRRRCDCLRCCCCKRRHAHCNGAGTGVDSVIDSNTGGGWGDGGEEKVPGLTAATATIDVASMDVVENRMFDPTTTNVETTDAPSETTVDAASEVEEKHAEEKHAGEKTGEAKHTEDDSDSEEVSVSSVAFSHDYGENDGDSSESSTPSTHSSVATVVGTANHVDLEVVV